MGKPENCPSDPHYELFLLVDFKLQVHFTVIKLTASNGEKKAKSIDKFARFLQEKGALYSKYKELAPYFAIPYITDNQSHFLLTDIQKVLYKSFLFKFKLCARVHLNFLFMQEEWVQGLKQQWKSLLEKKVTHIHGDEKIRLEKQNKKYSLRKKFKQQ